jgi:hypothetical protein
MLIDKRGSNMAEAAIAIPVVLLILALANSVSRAGCVAMAARNAADYGARVGAVAGSNAPQWAKDAANASLEQAGISGALPAEAFLMDGDQTIVVIVRWVSPTVLSGFCSLYDQNCPMNFYGEARAVRKVERWWPVLGGT